MSWRAYNWYMQRVTGAALLVLLAMHFWVEHYAADVRHGELSYDIVHERFFNNPWFVAVDITFLFIALYHGLNGLRNIILDFGAVPPKLRTGITAIIVLLGLAWAYWGVTAFVGNKGLSKPLSEVKVASVR